LIDDKGLNKQGISYHRIGLSDRIRRTSFSPFCNLSILKAFRQAFKITTLPMGGGSGADFDPKENQIMK
jgi:hypothetical protein